MSVPALSADHAFEPSSQPLTVCLIEDETAVRLLMGRALRGAGYALVEARDGDEALCRIGSHPDHIDLVIADLGAIRLRDFPSRLSALRPGVRVLFTSGLPRHTLLSSGWFDPSLPLLEKPFRMLELIMRVGELVGDSVER